MLNRFFFIAIIIFLQTFNLVIPGQSRNDADTSKFRIGVQLGGGYGFKIRTSNYFDGDYSKSGFNFSVRLKWGSGKYFGSGIETGYIQISSLNDGRFVSSIGEAELEASLNAIPILFILSTQVFNFQIHVGTGYYNVISHTSVSGNAIVNSEWDFGYMLSVGYFIPSNSPLKFGTELKWNNITEVQTSIISLQIQMQCRIL